MLQFYWLGYSCKKPSWMRFSDLTSRIRCFFVCQTGVNEIAGGRGELFSLLSILNSSLPSLHPSSHSALHYGRPCPPRRGKGGLAKVVNGQPEHVIGAHPCIVNVLQDETLLETHNLVIICLQTHTQR